MKGAAGDRADASRPGLSYWPELISPGRLAPRHNRPAGQQRETVLLTLRYRNDPVQAADGHGSRARRRRAIPDRTMGVGAPTHHGSVRQQGKAVFKPGSDLRDP